jgi:hypothetical protein
MAKRERGQTLPVVTVAGSHADLGRTMGQARAAHIRHVIDEAAEFLREQKIDEAALRAQIASYVEAGERYFPHLMVELREMARGAGVPFDPLFRMNCYESRPPGMPFYRTRQRPAEPVPEAKDPGTTAVANTPAARAADGCTSVASVGKGGVVAGHTEDSFPEAADGLYLLDATVSGPVAGNGHVTNRFFTLNYAQTLPGCAAAVNQYGLIILIDALPDPDRNVGVPRHMVSRALLDQPSIDAALDLLGTVPRGGGWNYLMAQGSRCVNVEATATRVVVTDAGTAGAVAHTNHYRDAELAAKTGEPRPNSFTRLTRALELVAPGMSAADVKRLLSDRQGFPDSICRERTIGAFIADTATRSIEVCWGEPDEGTWTSHAY